MRKSRKRKQKEGGGSKERNTEVEAVAVAVADGGSEGGGRFYGCYLLTSLNPRYKGHSYIGFTVNPKRRIRQHNGEITSGANRTKKKRPWDMVLCIHGFPTNVAALQFEWAWQHPKESIAVREAASSFKTLGGLPNKIKLALTMLSLPSSSWHCMDLTVSFFSTTYMKHAAGCPALPPHMKLHFSSIDHLPCYFNPHFPCPTSHHDFDNDDDYNDNDNDNDHDHDLAHEDDEDNDHHDIDLDCHSTHHTPTFGVIHTSPHTQTYNLQYAPQHIYDRPTLAGPSHKDPSYIMPYSTSEKQLPPLATYRDDHLRSLIPPPCTSIYSDKVFPSLKKHMEPCHQLPAHLYTSNFIDYTTPTKERCPQASFRNLKDQIEPIQPPDTGDYDSILKRGAKNESVTCVFINESPEEKRQQTGKCPLKNPSDTVGPSSTEGIEPVEVIDLFTPSPDCRIVAVSKKRRTSSDRSDIIDLTRSPLFLEL